MVMDGNSQHRQPETRELGLLGGIFTIVAEAQQSRREIDGLRGLTEERGFVRD
jgi:hypothetical protein